MNKIKVTIIRLRTAGMTRLILGFIMVASFVTALVFPTAFLAGIILVCTVAATVFRL